MQVLAGLRLTDECLKGHSNKTIKTTINTGMHSKSNLFLLPILYWPLLVRPNKSVSKTTELARARASPSQSGKTKP